MATGGFGDYDPSTTRHVYIHSEPIYYRNSQPLSDEEETKKESEPPKGPGTTFDPCGDEYNNLHQCLSDSPTPQCKDAAEALVQCRDKYDPTTQLIRLMMKNE